jgi:hypothetical protein
LSFFCVSGLCVLKTHAPMVRTHTVWVALNFCVLAHLFRYYAHSVHYHKAKHTQAQSIWGGRAKWT